MCLCSLCGVPFGAHMRARWFSQTHPDVPWFGKYNKGAVFLLQQRYAEAAGQFRDTLSLLKASAKPDEAHVKRCTHALNVASNPPVGDSVPRSLWVVCSLVLIRIAVHPFVHA